MGAMLFSELWTATGTLEDAFNDCRSEALYEHGHGGYTGSIAEKGSVVLRSKKIFSQEEALRFSEKDAENNEKWGPAFALKVGKGSPFGRLKNHKVKVSAATRHDAVRFAEKQAVSELQQIWGDDYTILVGVAEVIQKTRAEVKSTPLEKKRLFMVETQGRHVFVESKAEAKALLTSTLQQNIASGISSGGNCNGRIGAVTFTDLAEVVSAQSTWQVTVHAQRYSLPTEVTEFLFYGYASY